ncbi:rRNA small subunit pseudouridine methyltransferase Nep1 [Ranunculus cassubicifolius]
MGRLEDVQEVEGQEDVERQGDVQQVEGQEDAEKQGDVREVAGSEDVRDLEVAKTENLRNSHVENDTKVLEVVHELPGIPIITANNIARPGVIFIFEKASLVPAYVGKNHQILNPDDHANFLRKKKKDPYNYRPEIIHMALLEVIDSALYRAGMVQGIYVRTDEGVLIQIEPHTRLPLTFGSFCSMMLELLQKFSIKAKGKREKLLRLIENPVTKHLPSNCVKIGLSRSSEKVVPINDYVRSINKDQTLVFVVGAMAHGKIDSDYTDEVISVSQFPLSATACIRRICCAVEEEWNISI